MKLASKKMTRVPRVVMMTNNQRKRRSTTRAMYCQSSVIWGWGGVGVEGVGRGGGKQKR